LTPVNTGEWIDLELVLDFRTQTQEAFVDGVFIASAPFANASTELVQVEIFHINENEGPFYVDDLSSSAVPLPAGLWMLLGGTGVLVGVARRRPGSTRSGAAL
jgi:hypothetical protein